MLDTPPLITLTPPYYERFIYAADILPLPPLLFTPGELLPLRLLRFIYCH